MYIYTHTHTYIYIYIYIYILYQSIYLRYIFNYSPSIYEQIVGQPEIFNLGMATSLGEGIL